MSRALPPELLTSLKGIAGYDALSFEKVHAGGQQVTSVRINPSKFEQQHAAWSTGTITEATLQSPMPIPWSRYGYYLDQRPSFTFDPLFHAGCYYVQEASSMFLEQALSQTTDLSQPLRILDLSAAPGGKSTHIQSLISDDSLLVSNDVIRSRANILKENIIKWGSSNVVVTNNDPKDFRRLENYFDVIVVDAPCSGSGLFRRDPEAIDEWSPNNVQLCSQRQQRILADVWPALKKGGILIYSTCSYSKEEDEEILDWLCQEFNVESVRLIKENNWNIIESISTSGAYGYRFWPDKVKGEGFFLASIRKNEGDDKSAIRIKTTPAPVVKKEREIVEKWVQNKGLHFIKHLDTVYAWPSGLASDYSILLEKLRVIYSGVLVGQLVRDKLVPDHALALSDIVNKEVGNLELNYEQAIQYLQRKDINVDTPLKGWKKVVFQGHSLGWVNILPNRINNYYPKEMRILKGN